MELIFEEEARVGSPVREEHYFGDVEVLERGLVIAQALDFGIELGKLLPQRPVRG